MFGPDALVFTSSCCKRFLTADRVHVIFPMKEKPDDRHSVRSLPDFSRPIWKIKCASTNPMVYLPFSSLLYPSLLSLYGYLWAWDKIGGKIWEWSSSRITGIGNTPSYNLVYKRACELTSAWSEAISKLCICSTLITGFKRDQCKYQPNVWIKGAWDYSHVPPPKCNCSPATEFFSLFYQFFVSKDMTRARQIFQMPLITRKKAKRLYMNPGIFHARTKTHCNKSASIKHCKGCIICSRERRFCWNILPFHTEITFVFI